MTQGAISPAWDPSELEEIEKSLSLEYQSIDTFDTPAKGSSILGGGN